MSGGSFEAIAEFWDEQVGQDGDFFHNHLVRPALLRVLGDVRGLSVLDLGCANGATSRAVARLGARVTAVDISETLIARARAREEAEPLGIDYIAADAARLDALGTDSFDRVIANMSLMDVEDAEGMIREVGRVLKPDGRFVATLFHPCFQVPEASSWLVEDIELRRQISRRIWRYRECFDTPILAKPDQPTPTRTYHRPLGWYAEQLVRHGLLIDALDEPVPDQAFAERSPELYQRQMVAPLILVIGARRVA